MRTLAAPSLGSADLAVWTVEMRAGRTGPLHRAEHEQVWVVLEGRLAVNDADYAVRRDRRDRGRRGAPHHRPRALPRPRRQPRRRHRHDGRGHPPAPVGILADLTTRGLTPLGWGQMELVELPGDHDEVERGQLIDGEADVYELANFVLPPGRAKDRRFVLREDGRLIASAGILTAAVAIDEHAFSVVGIGGVLVTHTRRGQGLFRRVMEPALEAARATRPALRAALLPAQERVPVREARLRHGRRAGHVHRPGDPARHDVAPARSGTRSGRPDPSRSWDRCSDPRRTRMASFRQLEDLPLTWPSPGSASATCTASRPRSASSSSTRTPSCRRTATTTSRSGC